MAKKILLSMILILNCMLVINPVKAKPGDVYRIEEWCEFDPNDRDLADTCKAFCQKSGKSKVIMYKKGDYLCDDKNKEAKKNGNKKKFHRIRCECTE